MAGTEDQQLAALASRLHSHYTAVPPQRVDELIGKHHESFTSAKIRDFVPLLVERAVRRDLADVTGQRVPAEELVVIADT